MLKLQRPEQTDRIEWVVADYLKENPDFLLRHPDLFAQIELAHGMHGASSLLERQVRTLRDQVEQYRRRLEDLLLVARDNDTLNRRLHEVILGVIGAGDRNELEAWLQEILLYEFDTDAVQLALYPDAPQAEETLFFEMVDDGHPYCGPLHRSQLDYLFGEQGREIRSAALIPLYGQRMLGLLAFGSQDEERFHPQMETDYLERLGVVIARKLESLEPEYLDE